MSSFRTVKVIIRNANICPSLYLKLGTTRKKNFKPLFFTHFFHIFISISPRISSTCDSLFIPWPPLSYQVTRILLLWVNNHFTDFELDSEMMDLLDRFETKLEAAKMQGQLRMLNFACAAKARPRYIDTVVITKSLFCQCDQLIGGRNKVLLNTGTVCRHSAMYSFYFKVYTEVYCSLPAVMLCSLSSCGCCCCYYEMKTIYFR